VTGTEILQNKDVRGACEKPRGKDARPSASDGRGADTEKEERGTLPEANLDTETVQGWAGECKDGDRPEGEPENFTPPRSPAVAGPRRVRVRSA